MKKQTVYLLLKLLIVGALCFAVFPFSSCTKESEVIKLNLAFAGGPQSFSARAHVWWAEEVERRTNGRIKITFHWGGSLARHNEMVKLVGSGAVDMGESVWAPYNPMTFPLHTVTDGPVIWSRRPMALLYAGIQLEKEFPEVVAENTRANLKRLTWQSAGISGIMLKNKAVRKVGDLKGLQIRTAGKFMQPPLIKVVGAVPVGIPFPALYDSMQKGMMDGATGTMGLFVGIKFQEICDYYVEIGMGGDPGQGIMMNLDKYNSLPEDIKEILMQLYEKDFPRVFVEQFAVPEYKRSLEIFKKEGVEIIRFPDAEIEKWKALEPTEKHVTPWIKAIVKGSHLPEPRVREIMERYKQLIDEYEKIYTDVW